MDEPGGVSAEAPRIPVVTAVAVVRPLGIQIEAVGTARARESVDVTSKTTNTVVAIRFKEGDLVRKGDVLVELDSAEARAELEEAQAALADSENQFRRGQDLFTQQALSISQLDTIEATLKANRARVSAAKARLDDTVIRASFDGRTGFRRVSVGSLVNPGTVITTLDDSSVIHLDFTVPETYLYVLERGLEVSARTAGLPDREFKGTVSNINSRVDPVTRSIVVRAEIPNDDGLLRPGMFMTVTLYGKPEPTLLVPEAAIVPEQGKTFVFVVRDDVVERREVRTGKRRPGEVEIVEGLREHEHVIIEGTQNVRDGSRVQAELSEPAPSS
ncbi:MAG: efflux RND transporter periplasmic adaptor subunit [Xanthomonadaceae bacterium]|nr:efflux RND transporter periplasmic adaptor subunit [Xanthomonadaceae bacterium]